MIESIQNIFKIPELRKRVLFSLGMLVVYRIGCHIPTPGIDSQALAHFFKQAQGTLLGMFDMFSGGALEKLTVFALGIMPYISSSIIFQLMTVVVPAIERLRDWKPWLEWAGQLPTVVLQEKVSAALDALPRGREPSPPGERFRRTVLAAMSDIEAMELVDRFFEVGAEVVGTPHPIGIFLAGCRECLGEWELQASRWAHPSSGRARDPIALDRTVCPHGQTAEPNGDAQT